MPWVPGAARSLIILSYLLLRASFWSFWSMYDYCIYCLFSVHALLFWEMRICQLPAVSNGDIRSIYVIDSVSVCLYFWGTTSRPVGVAYHLYILCMSLYCSYLCCWWIFLVWSLVGVAYTVIYTYCWRLGLAGSRHLAYLYVLVACFIHRRPVPIFGPGGLLSVK